MPSVEAIYHSLPEDLWDLIVCLAPFASEANAEVLDGYQQNLQAQVVLATLPFNRLGGRSQDAAVHSHVLNFVAWLWQEHGDESLPNGVAQVLGTTRAKAEDAMHEALRKESSQLTHK